MKKSTSILVISTMFCLPVLAQEEMDEGEDLALKLANPVAALISVPIQANYDENFNVDDRGSMWKINVQPVIPFELNEDWNLITRTIIPIIDQQDVPADGMSEFGLGDINLSLFFTPRDPIGGWILGAGPVALFPSGTDETLSAKKWGAGPTAVALRQEGSWTYGALTNHIWSYAGDSDRQEVNVTLVQPFISYVTDTKTTLSLSSEATYDWARDSWGVPINAMVSQMLKVGPQIFQVGVGARYWAESTETGPEGWGARIQITFLFPR